MSGPATPRVALLVRSGCHLCEAARAELAELCASLQVRFAETDVDTDPQLAARYGEYVPVIVVDGRVIGWFRLDRQAVRTALGMAESAAGSVSG